LARGATLGSRGSGDASRPLGCRVRARSEALLRRRRMARGRPVPGARRALPRSVVGSRGRGASAMTPSPREARLAQEIFRLEGASAVKRLQRALGYYLDQGAWDEAADLFADDATIEVGLDGVYRGRERIRRYLYALG